MVNSWRRSSATWTIKKLDTARQPKAIDLGAETETVLGIYKLEGDTLVICQGPSGKERPSSFATEAEGDNSLFVLRRLNKRRGGPQDYNAVFVKTLGVMGEHFEQITYANRYDGRIDACSVRAVTKRPAVIRQASVAEPRVVGDRANRA